MTIEILDDGTPELDETFNILLYNVSGKNERLRNGAVSILHYFCNLNQIPAGKLALFWCF